MATGLIFKLGHLSDAAKTLGHEINHFIAARSVAFERQVSPDSRLWNPSNDLLLNVIRKDLDHITVRPVSGHSEFKRHPTAFLAEKVATSEEAAKFREETSCGSQGKPRDELIS